MMLDRSLTASVLARLGLSANITPDEAGLTMVYRAWCEHIPFDNVLQRIARSSGRGVGEQPSPQGFFEDWLRWGVGNICWSGNEALRALLEALGFQTERALATILPSLYVSGSNHGTVLVHLDSKVVAVDVMFMTGQPVPLLPGEKQLLPRAEMRKDKWYIVWRTFSQPAGMFCRLDARGVEHARFLEREALTRGRASFHYEATLRIRRKRRVVGFARGFRFELAEDGTLLTEPLDYAGRMAFLRDVGIDAGVAAALPDDDELPDLKSLRAEPA